MAKHPGSIRERSGKFYIRHYKGGKQVMEFLVNKDEKHHSTRCKSVVSLANDFMAKKARTREGTSTLSDFWDETYLPWAEKNLRPSTVSSYEDLWQRKLKPEIGTVPIGEFKSSDATKLLSKLAESLGRNSVAHLRSLLSGVFSHGCAIGVIDHNPIRDCKVLTKPRPTPPSQFYTREEAEAIIADLDGMPDCQAVCAVLFYCGLRPSECAALKWADIDLENCTLTVSRGWVRGAQTDLKTPESHATLPLVPQVLVPLRAWKEKSTPVHGWVFENERGKPHSLREMARSRIRPRLEEKGREWKSFYAFRRGLGTLIARMRGPLAASQALRHRNMSVTMSHYIRQDKRELEAAMKQLGQGSAE